MKREEHEDLTIYRVIVNEEEGYSIWPTRLENPWGWIDAGKSGLKTECIAYIREKMEAIRQAQ